jgi:hypothetical protein
MKKTMNYEAPVAEMIKLQASMILMGSGGGTTPTPTPSDPTEPGNQGGQGTGYEPSPTSPTFS